MKVKVQLATGVARVVNINPDATNGATLDSNLFLANGQVATPQTLREYILGLGAGNLRHSSLSGLQIGDDHPQYTMWADRERITGQWRFTKPIWGANGTATDPSYTFFEDQNTGMYRVGADNLGLSVGGVGHWDMTSARVFQDVPLVVNNNDGIFVESEADDDVGFEIKVFDDPGLFGSGGHLAFWETANKLYGMRIRHEGDLDPAGGDLVFYGHDNSATGIRILTLSRDSAQVKFENGIAALPSLTFRQDLNTGIYSAGTDTIGFTTGGTNRLSIVSSTQFTATLPWRGQNGTEAAPAFSFSGDTNTGIYSAFADGIGFSAGGASRATISGARVWASVPFQPNGGSADAPLYSFDADGNTGMYAAGADQIGFTTGGINRLSISTTNFTATLPWRGANGSATAPAFSFSGDTNTGLYAIGADQLGVAEGGAQTMRLAFANPSASIGLTAVNGTSLQPMRSDAAPALSQSISPTWTGNHAFSNAVLVADGSAATPGVAFSADSNTGVYRIGADAVGVACGGVLRLSVTSTIARITGTTAIMELEDTDEASEEKIWRLDNFGGDFRFATRADDDSPGQLAILVARTGTTVTSIQLYANSTESGRFDNDSTAGNTRFLIYDVDNGTLERVSVGVADSGGLGFKVLRIPN